MSARTTERTLSVLAPHGATLAATEYLPAGDPDEGAGA